MKIKHYAHKTIKTLASPKIGGVLMIATAIYQLINIVHTVVVESDKTVGFKQR